MILNWQAINTLPMNCRQTRRQLADELPTNCRSELARELCSILQKSSRASSLLQGKQGKQGKQVSSGAGSEGLYGFGDLAQGLGAGLQVGRENGGHALEHLHR